MGRVRVAGLLAPAGRRALPAVYVSRDASLPSVTACFLLRLPSPGNKGLVLIASTPISVGLAASYSSRCLVLQKVTPVDLGIRV